jgi:hypothetical protein
LLASARARKICTRSRSATTARTGAGAGRLPARWSLSALALPRPPPRPSQEPAPALLAAAFPQPGSPSLASTGGVGAPRQALPPPAGEPSPCARRVTLPLEPPGRRPISGTSGGSAVRGPSHANSKHQSCQHHWRGRPPLWHLRSVRPIVQSAAASPPAPTHGHHRAGGATACPSGASGQRAEDLPRYLAADARPDAALADGATRGWLRPRLPAAGAQRAKRVTCEWRAWRPPGPLPSRLRSGLDEHDTCALGLRPSHRIPA